MNVRRFTLPRLGAPERRQMAAKDAKGLRSLALHRNLGVAGFGEGEWIQEGRRRYWRLVLQSSAARALRLHFDQVTLDAGELWVYALAHPEGEQFVYRGKGPHGDGEFWSHVIAGEAAVVEYHPAGKVPSGRLPFRLDKISHFTMDPFAEPEGLAGDDAEANATNPRNVATCHPDVSCQSQWAAASRAVAHLAFESDGAGYVCTGSLLNTMSNRRIPYLITNAHCINSEATARTLVARFNYRTNGCNGPVLAGEQVYGSTFLTAGSPQTIDFAFLRLNEAAPPSASFLGWTTARMPVGSQLAQVHHPAGSFMRFALGTVTSSAENIDVRWTNGLGEGGSSGSPVFSANNPNQITGLHAYGNQRQFGNNVCSAVSTGAVMGGGPSFGAIFPAISSYLNDTAVCNYTVAPLLANVAAAGGDLNVSVNAGATCPWRPESDVNWIQVVSGGGSGNGSARLRVSANTGGARSGTVRVAGQTVTVNQASSGGGCSVTSLPAGTVSGNITAACASTRRTGRYAALFRFEGSPGQRISLRVASSWDSYMYLIGPDGRILAEDDDGAGELQSRIPAESGTLELPQSGAYTVEVSTYDPNVTGSFSLTLERQNPVSQSIQFNPSRHEASADVGTQTAVFVIEASGPADTLRLGARPNWLEVVAQSATLPGRISIRYNAANLGAGIYTGSLQVQAGTQTALLPVTLTVSRPLSGVCSPEAISFGSTVNGSLSATSCRSRFRNGAYARNYSFAANAGDRVRLTMRSSVLDTYLYLLHANAVILAEDDDSAGDLNSRIPADAGAFLTLPATGTYLIEATTFDDAAAGSFTLQLERAGGGTSMVPAELTAPSPLSRLAASCVTFRWNPAAGAQDYYIEAGSTLGGTNYFNDSVGRVLGREICGLPTDGSTVHLKLWTLFAGGVWMERAYTFVAAESAPPPVSTPASLLSPAVSSVLPGACATFSWTLPAQAQDIFLEVTGVNGGEYFSSSVGRVSSRQVCGLPTNGTALLLRLWTWFGGENWQANTYRFTAANNVGLTLSPAVVGCGVHTVDLAWNIAGAGDVQVRVGSPTGAAMTGFLANPGSARSGNWVAHGTQFFLVNRQGLPVAEATATSNCTGREARILADPNPSVACTNGLARAELRWTAPGQSNVSVRIGSVNGNDVTGPRPGQGSLTTGDWVANGMVFVLRASNGAELARTSVGTNCAGR